MLIHAAQQQHACASQRHALHHQHAVRMDSSLRLSVRDVVAASTSASAKDLHVHLLMMSHVRVVWFRLPLIQPLVAQPLFANATHPSVLQSSPNAHQDSREFRSARRETAARCSNANATNLSAQLNLQHHAHHCQDTDSSRLVFHNVQPDYQNVAQVSTRRFAHVISTAVQLVMSFAQLTKESTSPTSESVAHNTLVNAMLTSVTVVYTLAQVDNTWLRRLSTHAALPLNVHVMHAPNQRYARKDTQLSRSLIPVDVSPEHAHHHNSVSTTEIHTHQDSHGWKTSAPNVHAPTHQTVVANMRPAVLPSSAVPAVKDTLTFQLQDSAVVIVYQLFATTSPSNTLQDRHGPHQTMHAQHASV